MKSLELKIHPPIILLSAILMAYLFSSYLPIYPLPQLFTDAVWYLAGTGVFIAFCGVWQFRRAQTTIDPTRPHKTSHLVTTGIYRFTRNPMYLGMVFIMFAAVCKFADLSGALAIGFFMAYITQFQIKPEERFIAKLFTSEYSEYQSKVRRWI